MAPFKLAFFLFLFLLFGPFLIVLLFFCLLFGVGAPPSGPHPCSPPFKAPHFTTSKNVWFHPTLNFGVLPFCLGSDWCPSLVTLKCHQPRTLEHPNTSTTNLRDASGNNSCSDVPPDLANRASTHRYKTFFPLVATILALLPQQPGLPIENRKGIIGSPCSPTRLA